MVLGPREAPLTNAARCLRPRPRHSGFKASRGSIARPAAHQRFASRRMVHGEISLSSCRDSYPATSYQLAWRTRPLTLPRIHAPRHRRCATRSMTGTASRCFSTAAWSARCNTPPVPCETLVEVPCRGVCQAGSASEQPTGAAATTDMTEAEEGHLARSARTGSGPSIAEPRNRHGMALSSSSAAPGQSATNAENTAWRQCPSPRIPVHETAPDDAGIP